MWGKGKPSGEYKNETYPQLIIISLNSVGGGIFEEALLSKCCYRFYLIESSSVQLLRMESGARNYTSPRQLPPALPLPENSNPLKFMYLLTNAYCLIIQIETKNNVQEDLLQ